MLNSKTIGNKIATARKKINFSQADLAQQVSISSQAVGKWERGESLPDITTLNRLAEILGVDLNYFSDSFPNIETKADSANDKLGKKVAEISSPKSRKIFDWNWDMSKGNWLDADFSGLKNLKEKFSSSNIKNCKFINSDLSDLTLRSNNIECCDFTSSDLRNSKIQMSNLLKNQFNNSSFIDAQFSRDNIEKCDFSAANFSGAEMSGVYFEKNIISNVVWKFTSFKNTGIKDVIFEGTIEDCHFESCSFYNVTFQNATILNTFFKYNDKFKKVKFIDCTADNITYAFLKNNQADLTGVTVLT